MLVAIAFFRLPWTQNTHTSNMESGVGGSSGLNVSLDRLPSFAESEGAFSTATDAESEITEASITPRQTYFLCYATDCLSAYELIKKRTQSGVRALDDVRTAVVVLVMTNVEQLPLLLLLCIALLIVWGKASRWRVCIVSIKYCFGVQWTTLRKLTRCSTTRIPARYWYFSCCVQYSVSCTSSHVRALL